MKIIIILIILSTINYYNDNNLIYRLCNEALNISYYQSFDYEKQILIINKNVLEKNFNNYVNLNLNTRILYQDIIFKFDYQKNIVFVHVHYQKLFLKNNFTIVIGE